MIKELLIDSVSKFINVIRIPCLYALLNYFEYDSQAIKHFSVYFSVLMLVSSVISFGLFDQLNREAILAPLINRANIFLGSIGALIISIALSLLCIWIYLAYYAKVEFLYLLLFISILIFIKNSISIYLRANAFFSKIVYISLVDFVCVLVAGFLAVYFDNIKILLVGNGVSAVFILIFIFIYHLQYRNAISDYVRIEKIKIMLKDFSSKFRYALPSLLYVSMYWGVSLALKKNNSNSVDVKYFYFIDICYSAIFPAVAFLISFFSIKSLLGFNFLFKLRIFHMILGVVALFSALFLNLNLGMIMPALGVLVVIFAVEFFGLSLFALIYMFFLLVSAVYMVNDWLQFYFLLMSLVAAFVASKFNVFFVGFSIGNSKSVDRV